VINERLWRMPHRANAAELSFLLGALWMGDEHPGFRDPHAACLSPPDLTLKYACASADSNTMRSLLVLLSVVCILFALPASAAASGIEGDSQIVRDFDASAVRSPEGRGVTVAVIDTGLPAAWPGRRLPGVDMMLGGAVTIDGGIADKDLLHGTAVADIIRAYAPSATILPIRVVDLNDRTPDSRIADAVDTASQQGAKVINISLGGEPEPGQKIVDAIIRAAAAGVIVVCAAGNDAGPVGAPADIPGCLAISALDDRGLIAPYSNRGPQIALAAPAIAIGHQLDGTAVPVVGTSFAAPRVSGIAASLLGSGLTSEQAVRAMLLSATSIPTHRNLYGAGIVNHDRAMNWATRPACARRLRVQASGITRAFAACSPLLTRWLARPRRTEQGGLVWTDEMGHVVYRAPARARRAVFDRIGSGRWSIDIELTANAQRTQMISWPKPPAIMPEIYHAPILPATPPALTRGTPADPSASAPTPTDLGPIVMVPTNVTNNG
jgi:hypothetical protein